MIKKYLWIIMVYCFVAGNPVFATGGIGGTGVNDSSKGSIGMGTDYSLLPSLSE